MGLIQERGYVLKNEGRLAPTAIGLVVCDALVATFADIMDLGYTATMETRLDQVAGGEMAYGAMLSDFYRGFQPELESAKGAMGQAVEQAMWAGLPEELRTRTCPKCGKPLGVRPERCGALPGLHRLPRLPLHPRPRHAREPHRGGSTICRGGSVRAVRRADEDPHSRAKQIPGGARTIPLARTPAPS